MTRDSRGRSTDELEDLELVVELADDDQKVEAPPQGERETTAEEIRLNREQTLHDLRELQDLTIARDTGKDSSED